MFEEVKEMIDSTVYTNGNGEVTAQNINLALHGIVEATGDKIEEVETEINQLGEKVAEIGENGVGGGSGALRVWANEIYDKENTAEQIAENVATYNAIASGETVPVVLCVHAEEEIQLQEISGTVEQLTTFPVATLATMNDFPDYPEYSGTTIRFYSDKDATDGFVILNPDGSVTFEEPPTPSTPASNGPLRVWINEANTTEQIEENAATYNAIVNNNAQNVIAVIALSEEGTTMTRIFNVLSMVVLSGNLNDVVLTFATEWENGIASLMSIVLYEDGTFELA